MDQQSQETSEVLTFAPRQGMCDPIDQAGQALVGMLNGRALSQQNVERAVTMAHQLSMQLRASEDRVQQLESEVEHLESRARRSEGWLQAIKQEIED